MMKLCAIMKGHSKLAETPFLGKLHARHQRQNCIKCDLILVNRHYIYPVKKSLKQKMTAWLLIHNYTALKRDTSLKWYL